jgi:hypothetical protein
MKNFSLLLSHLFIISTTSRTNKSIIRIYLSYIHSIAISQSSSSFPRTESRKNIYLKWLRLELLFYVTEYPCYIGIRFVCHSLSLSPHTFLTNLQLFFLSVFILFRTPLLPPLCTKESYILQVLHYSEDVLVKSSIFMSLSPS